MPKPPTEGTTVGAGEGATGSFRCVAIQARVTRSARSTTAPTATRIRRVRRCASSGSVVIADAKVGAPGSRTLTRGSPGLGQAVADTLPARGRTDAGGGPTTAGAARSAL